MNEVIYDSDGDPIGLQRNSWSFSWWDMAGALTFTVAGLFKTLGQGLDIFGREFTAAANDERDRRANYEYQMHLAMQQRQADAELRGILSLPEADGDDIPAVER